MGVRGRPALLGSVALALALVHAACGVARAGSERADAAPFAGDRRERVELILDPADLPASDRERSRDRLDAIAESIAANVPLFRSFDPRDVLAESLATLAGMGADVAPGSGAILNFDTFEVDVPAGARDALAALPWVAEVRSPLLATSSGQLDSEGLELIGSEVANLAGVTGNGITVAIIDDGFNHLNATMLDPNGELETIPLEDQYRVSKAGNSTINVALDGLATQALEGEHGTACAEVVYEVAPGVDFMLFGFDPQNFLSQFEGGVTAAQIQFAIRKAADLGADVILVPMFIMSTMSDPIGVGVGGKNVFTDDVDYATSLGAVVVVSAGNEDLRHVEETFTPCPFCTLESSGGICAQAGNDTAYHTWDPTEEVIGPTPLNDLLFGEEVIEDGTIEHMTCYTATDSPTPSNFEVKLFQYFDPNSVCAGACPSDACMTGIDGTGRDLNQGFSVKNRALRSQQGDEYQYFLTVRRKGAVTPLCQGAGAKKCVQDGVTACTSDANCLGVPWPKIRVACTTSVARLGWSTSTGKSLSDLAVLTNAISVGAVDDVGDPLCDFDATGHCTSRGPTSLAGGPLKPDLVGPGLVTNFAVWDYNVSFLSAFVGSSAAAAHVAGLSALLQSQALQDTGTMLTPAAVRATLIRGAIPLATAPADDVVFGAGLAHIPDPSPGPLLFTAMTPCRVFDTRTMPGPSGPPQPLQAGVERAIEIAGNCGIPHGAKAVAAIVTVANPSATAHVRLYPGDSLLPNTSSINFPAGRTIANNIMLKLADNDTGSARAYLPVGTADLILDATGYYE